MAGFIIPAGPVTCPDERCRKALTTELSSPPSRRDRINTVRRNCQREPIAYTAGQMIEETRIRFDYIINRTTFLLLFFC